MRNKCVQMTLSDICNDVPETIENQKPELIHLLDEHIDFDSLIPSDFKFAFYHRYGRSNVYSLESFVRALTLQKLLGITTDKLLIAILNLSFELRVAENNPKFMNTKLKDAKKLAKANTEYDPYRGVYNLLPDVSLTNEDAKQQHINGHFCYAMKLGIKKPELYKSIRKLIA